MELTLCLCPARGLHQFEARQPLRILLPYLVLGQGEPATVRVLGIRRDHIIEDETACSCYTNIEA